MAVLIKRNARKMSSFGPLSVSFGNYPIPGLLKNKHIRVTIGNASTDVKLRNYLLSMSMEEATLMAIQALRYAMEHDDLKFSQIKANLLAPPSLGSSFWFEDDTITKKERETLAALREGKAKVVLS